MNFLGLSQSFLSVGFGVSLVFSIILFRDGDYRMTKTCSMVKDHLEESFSQCRRLPSEMRCAFRVVNRYGASYDAREQQDRISRLG